MGGEIGGKISLPALKLRAREPPPLPTKGKNWRKLQEEEVCGQKQPPPPPPNTVTVGRLGQLDNVDNELLNIELLRGTRFLKKNSRRLTPVEVDRFAPPLSS